MCPTSAFSALKRASYFAIFLQIGYVGTTKNMFSHTERSEIYKSKIHGPSLGALALNLTMQPSHDFFCESFLDRTKISFPHCCEKDPSFFASSFKKKIFLVPLLVVVQPAKSLLESSSSSYKLFAERRQAKVLSSFFQSPLHKSNCKKKEK